MQLTSFLKYNKKYREVLPVNEIKQLMNIKYRVVSTVNQFLQQDTCITKDKFK